MIILIRKITQLIIMTISIITVITIIMTIIIMISFCLTELKIFGDWLMASFSLRADNRSLLQDVKTCTYYSHCIVYFTEIFIKINLLDNSSIIHKVQSYTMSFNNQKNNTITIFRLENWTHLIFWFLFLKSPLFNKLFCSAQQQEGRVKTHSSSNLWIIVYTFLVKDYVYSFNYRNKFHKRYT